MELTTECLECMLHRNLSTARALGDEATAMAFARELMQAVLDAPAGVTTPYFSPITADLFQKYYRLDPDRFAKEKAQANAFVLERMDRIRACVRSAPDPVYAAMQYAVLGNYLDYSALGDRVDLNALDETLEKGREIPLDTAVYRKFRRDLEQAGSLLLLTDNAGEIGFDRILGECIRDACPGLSVTFCVRGGPAVNDATREDARRMGIPFPVIDNGTRISGTELRCIGPQARQALETADVILAKGQGNTETMYGCGLNVYYLFLVKCKRFMDAFHRPQFTPMLVRERDGTQEGAERK